MSDIKKPTPVPSKQEYLANKTPEEHLDDFFRMHLPTIHSIAHQYHRDAGVHNMNDESGNPIDAEDLYEPAYEGFYSAVHSYDPERKSGPLNKPMSWKNFLSQQINFNLKSFVNNKTGYSRNKSAAAKIQTQKAGQSED